MKINFMIFIYLDKLNSGNRIDRDSLSKLVKPNLISNSSFIFFYTISSSDQYHLQMIIDYRVIFHLKIFDHHLVKAMSHYAKVQLIPNNLLKIMMMMMMF